MRLHLRILTYLIFATTLFAQSDQVAPGANLVAEGIPPIPSDLAQHAAKYTKGRAAEILDWHPTKQEMLIVTFFGNVPQIHRVKFPGGARTQLTFFDDNPSRGVSYHPTTGDYFIFSKDVGGDQNYQIIVTISRPLTSPCSPMANRRTLQGFGQILATASFMDRHEETAKMLTFTP